MTFETMQPDRLCEWRLAFSDDAYLKTSQVVVPLGLHLDKKLTWQTHIKAKRRQLELKVRNMSWLINKKSQLSLENKITMYKAIIKPVWTYGIELWGCSKPSNTKILQTFQSKTLRNELMLLGTYRTFPYTTSYAYHM
jgi:hypothetical protein